MIVSYKYDLFYFELNREALLSFLDELNLIGESGWEVISYKYVGDCFVVLAKLRVETIS